MGVTTVYDPVYVALDYPGGPVPPERGGATDLVIRALRVAAGLDLHRADEPTHSLRDRPRALRSRRHPAGAPQPRPGAVEEDRLFGFPLTGHSRPELAKGMTDWRRA